MYSADEASAERLVDLSTPLSADVSLQLLTEKDADALKVVRHSAAHVMATAVLELIPRPSSATARRRMPDSFTISTGLHPLPPRP